MVNVREVRKNLFLSNVESIAYRYWFDNDQPRHNCVPYTRAHDRAKIWTDSLLAYDLSHRAHIYTYIPRNNHVILKMLLCPHTLLCIQKTYYGNTRKKKVRYNAIDLYCYYDHCIFSSIIIQFPKNPLHTHFIQILKRRLWRIFCVEPIWMS